MTTYEGVPSMSTYLSMKLANRISRTRRREASHTPNRVQAWMQAFVRLVATLAGFALLTWAGFTLNMTAGLITAGLSCFVFAWLMNDTSTVTDKPDRSSDPMASRR